MSRQDTEWSSSKELSDESERDSGVKNGRLIEEIILELETELENKFGAIVTGKVAQTAKTD